MHWLSSEHKNSALYNPITVKEFINDKHVLLYDSVAATDVTVDIIKGVPFCRFCDSDDCGHVGFTIYLDGLHGPGETIESIDTKER
jgi:hypothetical protein